MTRFPVMIFAAGFGTRMGALTKDRPKPLIEVAGKTLLDHALAFTEGVPVTVVNTHYRGDQIANHLRARPDIRISHEAPEVLETGGGLRQAMPLLGDGPVMTLNSDAVWHGPNPLDLLDKSWDPNRMDALLLTVAKDNAIGHAGTGDFVRDAQGRLTRGAGEVYAGAQILKTDLLSTVPDAAFSLNVIWNQMHDAGRLHGLSYPGKWCDVGRPEGIALAEDMLVHG